MPRKLFYRAYDMGFSNQYFESGLNWWFFISFIQNFSLFGVFIFLIAFWAPRLVMMQKLYLSRAWLSSMRWILLSRTLLLCVHVLSMLGLLLQLLFLAKLFINLKAWVQKISRMCPFYHNCEGNFRNSHQSSIACCGGNSSWNQFN